MNEINERIAELAQDFTIARTAGDEESMTLIEAELQSLEIELAESGLND